MRQNREGRGLGGHSPRRSSERATNRTEANRTAEGHSSRVGKTTYQNRCTGQATRAFRVIGLDDPGKTEKSMLTVGDTDTRAWMVQRNFCGGGDGGVLGDEQWSPRTSHWPAGCDWARRGWRGAGAACRNAVGADRTRGGLRASQGGGNRGPASSRGTFRITERVSETRDPEADGPR